MRRRARATSDGQALQAGLDVNLDERLGYHDEWRNHYQGGPIGYGAREFGPAPLAHPNAFTAYPVAGHQACAWNPTVQGTKSEDTFLIEEAGNRMITNSAAWPSLSIETGQRRDRAARHPRADMSGSREGIRALVTGASSGVGREVATQSAHDWRARGASRTARGRAARGRG